MAFQAGKRFAFAFFISHYFVPSRNLIYVGAGSQQYLREKFAMQIIFQFKLHKIFTQDRDCIGKIGYEGRKESEISLSKI